MLLEPEKNANNANVKNAKNVQTASAKKNAKNAKKREREELDRKAAVKSKVYATRVPFRASGRSSKIPASQ